ncbi:hypothetical protein MKW94_017902 [Papaver nudicaule]|uniref:Phenylalanyl-tRNA synthetase domain-containing protein n=1 Tax=Papaver nudicaule TaxID=74823 RepID=A0AA41RUN3_PAPNU|nr:hypothetical protein [Papaver nudicaule]
MQFTVILTRITRESSLNSTIYAQCVVVPADHASRSYNDTCYNDSQTAELLRSGHTHFLVTGDVYRRDFIDSTHYPVFHQWEASGKDGTTYAAEDLARHLCGNDGL